MEKSNKRKFRENGVADPEDKIKCKLKRSTDSINVQNKSSSNDDSNPLLTLQSNYLAKITPECALHHFFSPTHLTPDERSSIWSSQAEIGESLVNSYSWATPDSRALKVLKHFAPIVEVGCGANAYWAKWMKKGGVDVIALDIGLADGGKIRHIDHDEKKAQKSETGDGNRSGRQGNDNDDGIVIREGGPELLSSDPKIRDSGRTLFLCYPDEEDQKCLELKASVSNDGDGSKEESDDEEPFPTSMAYSCLDHFQGETVIHVGELYGDTLSLEQAPWGRSSSLEFQQRLASEYHCILKMKLNNWLHVRDTLSVWKRSQSCCMVFQKDDEASKDEIVGEEKEEESDESEEEVYYKYIPPEDMLPTDLAAPCVAHLLQSDEDGDEADANTKKSTTH